MNKNILVASMKFPTDYKNSSPSETLLIISYSVTGRFLQCNRTHASLDAWKNPPKCSCQTRLDKDIFRVKTADLGNLKRATERIVFISVGNSRCIVYSIPINLIYCVLLVSYGMYFYVQGETDVGKYRGDQGLPHQVLQYIHYLHSSHNM